MNKTVSDLAYLRNGRTRIGFSFIIDLVFTDTTGEALCGGLCMAGIACLIALWDTNDTTSDEIDTESAVADPCSSSGDKLVADGLLALGQTLSYNN